MKDFLRHLFIPHEGNNHRAKILHHQSLFLYVVAFVIGAFLISTIKTNSSQVLGTTTDISSEQLLQITNQKRQEAGFGALVLNDELSKAADAKANFMFAKNFWAHNSPDGVTPWVFIKNAGYPYVYAGENLARGFSTSQDIVEAWIESPSHRQNMLSSNYKEIGFSVKEGKLLGENTVLVVEMFGSRVEPQALSKQTSIAVQGIPNFAPAAHAPIAAAQAVKKQPFINGSSFTWNMSTLVLLLFICALVLDMFVVERKKVIRLVGHNADHILFLGMLLLFVILFSEGVIL